MDPITREEKYLNAILSGDTSDLPTPITRVEMYLYDIAMNGGGGGGTTNYNALNNKPQINNVELSGNKTASDLGLASRSEVRSVYRPSGDKTVAELTASLLIADNLGKVYNMTTTGTTTADFTCGAGKEIKLDDNVAIVDVGTDENPDYKFDLFSGMIDMSPFQTKALATPLYIKGDLKSTVETALEALAQDVYSTDEVKTNKVWIDGKPIYRKVLIIPSLPNGNANYPHGISNIDALVRVEFTAVWESGEATTVGGYIIPAGINYTIAATATKTDVIVRTGGDRHDVHGYAVLEYTKTTD